MILARDCNKCTSLDLCRSAPGAGKIPTFRGHLPYLGRQVARLATLCTHLIEITPALICSHFEPTQGCEKGKRIYSYLLLNRSSHVSDIFAGKGTHLTARSGPSRVGWKYPIGPMQAMAPNMTYAHTPGHIKLIPVMKTRPDDKSHSWQQQYDTDALQYQWIDMTNKESCAGHVIVANLEWMANACLVMSKKLHRRLLCKHLPQHRQLACSQVQTLHKGAIGYLLHHIEMSWKLAWHVRVGAFSFHPVTLY